MRRKDREITGRENIEPILRACKTCRVAMIADGAPYVVPLNFGYTWDDDGLTLYFHSGLKGKKIDALRADPRVCFELDTEQGVTGEGDTNIKLDGDNALKSDIYRSGIYGSGSGSLTISGGENDSLTAQGGSGANGISSSGSLTISGGTVNAAGGNGKNSNGGSDGIISNDIDLSGSLELTAKAGRPNGKAISWAGHELDLDTIKDKLGPGAKVTTTDANGKVNQVSIPRPVESSSSSSSSSSSDGGSAAPSAPASPLPGLTVTDRDGQRISYTSTQSGNTLTVCVGRLTASFRISLAALRQLRAEGIETIAFQTVLCSTTLSVDELLAMGGEDAEAVLTHRFTDSSLTVG